jgi:hypothetical protein
MEQEDKPSSQESDAERQATPEEQAQDAARLERLEHTQVPEGADVAFPEGRYEGAPPESSAIHGATPPRTTDPRTEADIAEMGRTGHAPRTEQQDQEQAAERAAEADEANRERARQDRERNLGEP